MSQELATGRPEIRVELSTGSTQRHSTYSSSRSPSPEPDHMHMVDSERRLGSPIQLNERFRHDKLPSSSIAQEHLRGTVSRNVSKYESLRAEYGNARSQSPTGSPLSPISRPVSRYGFTTAPTSPNLFRSVSVSTSEIPSISLEEDAAGESNTFQPEPRDNDASDLSAEASTSVLEARQSSCEKYLFNDMFGRVQKNESGPYLPTPPSSPRGPRQRRISPEYESRNEGTSRGSRLRTTRRQLRTTPDVIPSQLTEIRNAIDLLYKFLKRVYPLISEHWGLYLDNVIKNIQDISTDLSKPVFVYSKFRWSRLVNGIAIISSVLLRQTWPELHDAPPDVSTALILITKFNIRQLPLS
ncbi:hypothetical protein H072_246 [Dactylellina haptotyla CBS 200.50]|uniref:Uncharacterized protein n=1 Tax=Dactylellina haptotyla (strain CBS 200.50) TaxID=1284197 RepID=S8ASK8_DACHA|nr:hypothetical protein H072_246 [Dactylellina haptotyla CBS 200.50]